MQQTMKKALLALVLLALAGCSHTLFVGEMTTPNADGVDRQTQIYWFKTDPIGADPKAGPIVLRTACATPIQFVERPEGIVFFGEPDRDRLRVDADAGATAMICGRIDAPAGLVDLEAGELGVSIFCTPVADDFAVVPRNYPRSRNAPYRFMTTADQHWSLSGELPPAPAPPPCPE